MTDFSDVARCACGLAGGVIAVGGLQSAPKDEFAGRHAESDCTKRPADMDSGSYERAIKSLERVEGLAAGTLLAQQRLLDLAYLYWKTNEKAQALSTIERFIKLNPSSPALDYALYLRGVINFNDNLGLLGNLAGQDLSERDQRASRDAYQAFKQLIDQFPNSRYAADARLRMDYIVNSLAAYEVHVARYYFRRGAYVAAANRAQQAVTEFQQAPAIEEALHMMVQSYDKLDCCRCATAPSRVLRTELPATALPHGGHGEPGRKPWWQLLVIAFRGLAHARPAS
jgi:outer membrane protein assembly factor BamD